MRISGRFLLTIYILSVTPVVGIVFTFISLLFFCWSINTLFSILITIIIIIIGGGEGGGGSIPSFTRHDSDGDGIESSLTSKTTQYDVILLSIFTGTILYY